VAQRSIREHYAKSLLFYHLQKYLDNFDNNYKGIKVNPENIDKIKDPKFLEGYVAKPDELFGKRGKNGLIFINKDFKEIKKWIKQKMSQETKVIRSTDDKGITGTLQTFLIEPFFPHNFELYIAFKTEREYDTLFFSLEGGIEIEENWDKVHSFPIPFQLEIIDIDHKVKTSLQKHLSAYAPKIALKIIDFIEATYKVFKQLNFAYLEINPLAINNSEFQILDLVARLDDTAHYKSSSDWSAVQEPEFPYPFGSSSTDTEEKIRLLDSKTGASLKLTILNSQGRIWILTSGGGGSVIMTDTVGDLGFEKELANYGEYSGNPTTDETMTYADLVLKEMLKSKAKDKVLIVAGGIANFTDVKKTFTGIVMAIRENHEEIKKQKVKIFVRRGGPNDKAGLKYILEEVIKLGIYIETYDAKTYLTEIIKIALNKS
jgi:ATP-citrate lyase beta-subunit